MMSVTTEILALSPPPRGLYLAVFGAAAIICLGSLSRIGQVEDPDTRRGLAGLLLTSGLWAVGHTGFLAAGDQRVAIGFYMFGLVAGFATVGGWLYFVSAFTNRNYHRNPTYRRVAVAVFLLIVGVKLTNPVHHLYFTTEYVTQPFPHLTVRSQPLHWLAMGLSYALASIGYFAIFERLARVSYDTKPLMVLVGVTGLPVFLDVIGYASPALIDIPYEPIGVAVFAVGVFTVFLDRFQSIRVAGEHDDPVLVLDKAGRLMEFNDSAVALFPDALGPTALGTPLQQALPDLPDPAQPGPQIYERTTETETRYYQVSSNPFRSGETPLGELIILTDVTHRERYRRELERQNERLEEFAGMVSHDLRSPLTVAQGHLEMATAEAESDHIETASEALDRMNEIISEVLALARQGQPIDETEPVSLEQVARHSWGMIDSREATLEVAGTLEFEADEGRLRQLFENLFRNALEHAGPDVSVTVGTLEGGTGFFVADDGPGIPESERQQVFESGFRSSESGTGFGLAIAKEVVEAHGWSIRVGESETGGARFDIDGFDT